MNPPANATQPPPPLNGAALVIGTLSLSLATFMNVLDSTIANVSIPAISGDLGVSPAQGTWVITSFGVSNAIALPLTGWLAQRFGAVRTFLASVLLFVLTSWMCGLAPSMDALVACRVLQGLAAGPMVPLSQTLLLASYPRHLAGTALAFWGMTTLVAPVVGPLLGGWIADNFSWPWIFYINVPVGLLAAGLTLGVYRHRETPTRKLPIDRVGLALLVIWVGALQLMLDTGKEYDWFSSPLIVALGLVALIGFLVFVVWELTDAHPVVDLRLFAGRNFGFGVLALALAYGLFFANGVLMPLWLQQWMGYDATTSGLAVAPIGLLAILLTPLVGRRVGQWDPRWMATGAFIGFALILLIRAEFTTQVGFAQILVPTVMQGAAMAFFFIPLTTLTLAGLTPDRIPAAAGLSNFARIGAGAMGTSVATTLWEDRAAMHHAHMVEPLTAGQGAFADTLESLRAAGYGADQALAMVNRMIDQQAFTRAADDLFLGSAVLFAVLVSMIWMTRRPPRILPGAAPPVAPRSGGAR